MDMGIAGRWALVCAASKGLGRGCAQALAREGVNLVLTARGHDALVVVTLEQLLVVVLVAVDLRRIHAQALGQGA